MRCILTKAIPVMAVISTLFTTQMEATCSRCIKIEEERAKEQATHPQPWRYYDDLISLNTKEEKPAAKNEIFFEEEEVPLVKTEEIPHHEKRQTETEPQPTQPLDVLATTSKAYSSLYVILKTKNFLETLDGAFTLFIPTNEALQQSARDLMDLARPENAEKLTALVSHHVVAQKLLRKDFVEQHTLEVKSISGKNLTLSSKNGQLFIDNAQILRAEPAGHDGVIYVIDQVLPP